MSYFVVCTFDLKGATYGDYQNAYADLAALGLRRTVVSSQGEPVVAPTTMAMGELAGTSAGALRDYVSDRVQAAFRARRFTSEIFVVVAGDWAWGGRTT